MTKHQTDWTKVPSIIPKAWVIGDHTGLTEEEIIERNRVITISHLAVAFIENHGEFAIMRAMEEMMSENAEAKRTVDRWKDVIKEIERIQSYDPKET